MDRCGRFKLRRPDSRLLMAAEMDWWVSNTASTDSVVIWPAWCHMPSGSIRIPMLREKHGPLFFLAEWSEPHLLSTFNADYGWELHHLMNDIAKGHKNVHELEVMLRKNDTVYGEDAMKLYFTSNHDENSWQGSAIERMGDDARAFFALLS